MVTTDCMATYPKVMGEGGGEGGRLMRGAAHAIVALVVVVGEEVGRRAIVVCPR